MAAKKQVSLSDVARLCGVSVSTVSRVLNGRGGASPATEARIKDAAERLGFHPNALGRSLVTGRSGTIGVLAAHAPALFQAQVLVGVTVAIAGQKMATYLHDLGTTAKLLDSHVRMLQAGRVDGLIVVGRAGHETASVTDRFHVPVVYAHSPSTSEADTSFLPDERMAGQLAAEHLLGLGRRRIAHVTGSDLGAHARSAGLLAALDDAGAQLAGGRPWHGRWSKRSGYDLTRRLLDIDPDVDAIFCGNDPVAFGAHIALAQSGRQVPDDVALVGYDNMEALFGADGAFYTTIDPRRDELGSRAAQCLVDAIEGKPPAPGVQRVPCRLVARASTTGRGGDELPGMLPI